MKKENEWDDLIDEDAAQKKWDDLLDDAAKRIVDYTWPDREGTKTEAEINDILDIIKESFEETKAEFKERELIEEEFNFELN